MWWAREELNLRPLPCQIPRAPIGLYVGGLETGNDHWKPAGETKVSVIERSDDPPRFSNIRVDPYDGWLLPVCCLTRAKAYLQDHRRRGDDLPSLGRWRAVLATTRSLWSRCATDPARTKDPVWSRTPRAVQPVRDWEPERRPQLLPWATPFGPRLELNVGPGSVKRNRQELWISAPG